jgi:hypothetical protein
MECIWTFAPDQAATGLTRQTNLDSNDRGNDLLTNLMTKMAEIGSGWNIFKDSERTEHVQAIRISNVSARGSRLAYVLLFSNDTTPGTICFF